ncbi:MAG TPA: TPM domain-containing protein [Syntrophorhabdales bacterium]|nr:TPM domain-containing protein [Syntrophorhabdales bacterium]
MKVRAKDFFSKAQKTTIQQAVLEAEKDTSGEIVVKVVEACDRYRDAEILGSVLLSGLFGLIASLLLNHSTIWFYIPATFILFFPCRYLFKKAPHLKLALVSERDAMHEVSEEAIHTFYERGLHRTKHGTGILIFISLLERRVWILGDKGINDKVSPDFWHSLVAELTKGIREDKTLDALCSVIAKCGAELTKHFPGRHDGTDAPPGEDVIC